MAPLAGEAGRPSAGRPGQFKATQRKEAEAERRRAALAAQQSEARANRIADVRRIAMQSLLAGDGGKDGDEEVEVSDDDDEEEEDIDMQGRGNGKKMRRLRMLHKNLWFARQLQNPDWLLEMPQDLTSSWLVQVRPEGDRCLLLSNDGCVMVRRKNGTVLERYKDCRFPQGLTVLDVVCMDSEEDKERKGQPAALPEEAGEPFSPTGDAMEEEAAEEGLEESRADAAETPDGARGDMQDIQAADVDMGGGRGRGRGYSDRGGRGGRGTRGGRGGRGGRGQATGRGSRARPLGDCSYAVCDVLVWGDTELVSADAECRMFWLESRFSELPEKPSRRARPLKFIPAHPATPEVLSQAYHLDAGYMKDSLLFLHKQGWYAVADPVTPLALSWRDRQVSKWVIDTQDKTGQTLPERQAVVLEVRRHGWLRTADRRVVAQLNEEQLKEVSALAHGHATSKSKPLVRFEVQAVDIAARTVVIAKVVNYVAARSRVWADTWGRLVFQHLHRKGKTDRISFPAIMKAAIGDGAIAVDEDK